MSLLFRTKEEHCQGGGGETGWLLTGGKMAFKVAYATLNFKKAVDFSERNRILAVRPR
jgi:hypothetical protein